MRDQNVPCSQEEPNMFGVLLRKPVSESDLAEKYKFSVISMKEIFLLTRTN